MSGNSIKTTLGAYGVLKFKNIDFRVIIVIIPFVMITLLKGKLDTINLLNVLRGITFL